MPEKKPKKEKVLSALAKYKSAPEYRKIRFVLHSLRGKEKCYCIEGIFCEIAAELGYPGHYILSRPVSSRLGKTSVHAFVPKDCELSTPSEISETKAPEEIWPWLGLPRSVDHKFLLNLGGAYEEGLRELQHTLGDYTYDSRSTWYELNDCSQLTIRELLSLAEQLLKPGGTK